MGQTRWTFTVKAYDSPPRTPPQTCFVYLADTVADADAVTAITTFAGAVSNGKLLSISKQAWAAADQSVDNSYVLTANGGTDRVTVSMANRSVTPNVITKVSIPLTKRDQDNAAVIAALTALDIVGPSGLAPGNVFDVDRKDVTLGASV